MRMIWFGTFIALLVSGPAFGQTDLDGSFPGGGPIDFPSAHRLISSDFLDPSSAQYKQFVLVTRAADSKQYLCGWVNAKNSYGGYTPFYPFYIDLAAGDATVSQDYQDDILGPLARLPYEYIECARPLGLPPSHTNQ